MHIEIASYSSIILIMIIRWILAQVQVWQHVIHGYIGIKDGNLLLLILQRFGTGNLYLTQNMSGKAFARERHCKGKELSEIYVCSDRARTYSTWIVMAIE